MKKTLLIFSLLLVVVCPFNLYAATYYVDRTNLDPSFTNEGLNCSTPSDNDYNPATRQCGSGSDTVYNGGANVDTAVSAGDTVYWRAGVYKSSLDYYQGPSSISGTNTNPITLQTYPGETVTFSNPAGDTSVIFAISGDWFILDGFDLDYTTASGSYRLNITGNHNEVKNWTGNTATNFVQLSNFNTSLECQQASYNKIHDNNITGVGDACGGNGCGDFVYVRSGCFNWIYNNTIKNFGHAAIDIQRVSDPVYRPAKYNKVYSNTVDQSGGGGGFYINQASAYNLIENNIIKNIGGNPSITQNKGGLLIRGPNNTVRLNKIINYGRTETQAHRGIMVGSSVSFGNKYPHDNLVYNNVIYKGYGLPVYFREDSAGHVTTCSEFEVVDTIFANNAIYLAPQEKITSTSFVGSYTPQAYYGYYLQQRLGSGCTAWSPYANNNEFSNNYMYTGNHGAGQNDNWVGFYYGSGGHNNYVLNEENTYPDDFNDGTHVVDSNPKFNDPDNGDFTLQSGSPLIDAGVVISDTNGSYVESMYPGYGWSDLPFSGTTPDIGAHEYPEGRPSPPSNLRIVP